LAITPSDGTSYFQEVPNLDQMIVQPQSTPYVKLRGTRLEVTITVPPLAQVSLQSLLLDGSNNPDPLSINVKGIEAVLGSDGMQIPLTAKLSTTNAEEIEIRWSDPIKPGTTVTLEIPLTVSPSIPGSYRLGVTALPVGAKPHAYFLGYGMVSFDDRSNDGIKIPFL
jgi:hypothetical protein